MPNPKGLTIRIKLPTRIQPDFMPSPGRTGQYTNKIHHFKKYLLKELPHYDFTLPFMEPVDTKALRVPSYYTVIEHPMDMGTISMRVENDYYNGVDELIEDIRLVLSNCFLFNMPGSIVYRNGQELEKLFMKVLARMPKGEELPYSKEKGEKSIMKHQCRYRLRMLRDATESLEQDAQEFFCDQWLRISEALNSHKIKSLIDFDARLINVLKHCKDHGKRILDIYDYETNRLDDPQGKNGENDEFESKQCKKPMFDWEDSLIDDLDEALICLKQDLDQSRRGEQKKEKLCYSERLLPIFVNAQVICDGLYSQTNLSDSSDEDETEAKLSSVSVMERQSIREQFHDLFPEAMYDIMHIIEQSEFRSFSNSDRKYNMMHFSPKTMALIKKAIEIHRCSNAADGTANELYDSDDNEDAASDDEPYPGYDMPPRPNYYCYSSNGYAVSGSGITWGTRSKYYSITNKYNPSDAEDDEPITKAPTHFHNLMDTGEDS